MNKVEKMKKEIKDMTKHTLQKKLLESYELNIELIQHVEELHKDNTTLLSIANQYVKVETTYLQ